MRYCLLYAISQNPESKLHQYCCCVNKGVGILDFVLHFPGKSVKKQGRKVTFRNGY